MIKSKRITLFTGYFGCGKTEIAINYALKLAKEGKKTALIDLDIVNVYYRSRQKKELLENNGIRVISSVKGLENADLPAISRDIDSIFTNEEYHIVVDLGGEDAGAIVLGRFHSLLKESAQLLMILNTNRPFVSNKDEIIAARKVIEKASRLSVDGYVTNINLCEESTIEEIRSMNAQILSWFPGEVKTVVADRRFSSELGAHFNDIPVFYIDRYMRHQWEDGRIVLDNKV